MVEREKILQQLRQFIAEDTPVDPANLTENSSLRTDLGLDSVDLVAVVMRVEEVYDIRLSQEDMKDISTVRSVVDLILAKLAAPDELATSSQSLST